MYLIKQYAKNQEMIPNVVIVLFIYTFVFICVASPQYVAIFSGRNLHCAAALLLGCQTSRLEN